MKRSGVAIPGFKLKDGKVVRDSAASEAKLNVSLRLKRKNSRRVRVARKGQS